jgi:hypothetical protein
MSIVVQDALDYSPKEFSAGSYTWRIVNPENAQPVLALNSTVSTDFLLPNRVINLHRSYLEFDYTVEDGVGTAAGLYNHAHNGFLSEIDGIVLSTASGVRLVDENFLPYKTKLQWRAETDLQDFLTFPCHSHDEKTVADVKEAGRKFNRIRAANADGSDAAWLKSSYHISALAGTAQAAASDDYSAVSNYIGRSVTTAQNGDGDLAVRVRLPLSMIYGSLLAMDKDLYFNEQLRLTIRWNQGSKFGYLSAASARSIGAASVDLTETPVISNVRLRCAVETNEAISNALVARVLDGEGININMPFTYAYRSTSSSNVLDTNAVIRKLNRGHGSKCLRVFAGLFFPTQTGARYCTAYNVGGTVWSQWRPYVDSKPLTDNALLDADFSAYMYQAEMLKGSVIKGVKDFNEAPPLIVDFTGIPHSKDFPKNDDKVAGLDLTVEREFSMEYVNVPANVVAHLFAVCQKTLSINKQGISVF